MRREPPRLTVWLYRALVRLAPRKVRQRFADEQVALFEQVWHEERPIKPIAAAWWAVGLFWRAARGVMGQHADQLAWPALWSSAAAGPRRWLAALGTDLRHTLRTLIRARWFTAGAIATFTLGIGANVAVLSVVDRMLFRPMPYRDPGSLVQIHRFTIAGAAPYLSMDAALIQALRERARSFEDIAEAYPLSPAVLEGLGPEPAQLGVGTYNLLSVLGVRPVLGRDFTIEDARARSRLMLVSYDAWRTRLGGAWDSVGQTVGLAGDRYRIAGVLPPGFVLPSSKLLERFDGLVLSSDTFEGPLPQGWILVAPIGRLKPGMTPAAAQAEANVILESMRRHLTTRPSPESLQVLPIQTGLFLLYRPYLLLVITAVGIVLLVSCVNLSALLVARGRSRERDVALRAALGASGLRLLASALTEAVCLCGAAGLVAIFVFEGIRRWLVEAVPAALRGYTVGPFDVRIIGMTLMLAALSAAIAAVAPAWRLTRVDVLSTLQPAGRVRGRTRLWSGATLIAIETALGVVLVTGAGLTARNLVQLLFRDPGFQAKNLYLARIEHGYDVDRSATGLTSRDRSVPPVSLERVQRVGAALRASPQVAAIGIATAIPLGVTVSRGDFWITHGAPHSGVWGVDPGVFDALGARIIAGRSITWTDMSGRLPVAVLNERGAEQLWPTSDPGQAVGRTLDLGRRRFDVIGVVADIRPHPGSDSEPALFLPITDAEVPPYGSGLTAVIRIAPGAPLDGRALDSQLNRAFTRTANTTITPVETLLAPWLQQPRFQAELFGALAFIALLLAAIGLYAIASFEVARRQHEMGVRLALGAEASQLHRLVIGGTLRPVFAGAAAGLVVSWWAAKFLQAFLFDVNARGPLTFAAVALVLLVVAGTAAWLPARRAARTDPATVLRV